MQLTGLALSLSLIGCVARDANPPPMPEEERRAISQVLSQQFQRCLTVTSIATPKIPPQIRFSLNVDGSLADAPVLVNSSREPGFNELARAGSRAVVRCAPYQIPARFAPYHHAWRNVTFQINPLD
jgi:colicin import membrane protein